MKTKSGHIPKLERRAERPASDHAQPEAQAAAYASWRSQRGMLADKLRMRRFEEAIAALVKPGMHVVDVGCGSGILGFLAARSGAAQVYALETTSIIDDARRLAEANGLAKQMVFVRGEAANFDCPEPVDLVIAEWVGMYLFEEWRHFDAFARVRDACLRPGGKVVPAKARVFLSAIDDSRLYVQRGPGFWERPVQGFDFSLVHRQGLDRMRRIIVQADRRALLQPFEIVAIDCERADSGAFFFEHHHEMRLPHAATCHGFVGWFELDLAPGIVLDTSPFSIDTHWHQSYFPLEQIQLAAHDTLLIELRSVPDASSGAPVLEVRVTHKRADRTLGIQERSFTLEDTEG